MHNDVTCLHEINEGCCSDLVMARDVVLQSTIEIYDDAFISSKMSFITGNVALYHFTAKFLT
jgi:hypothetical protein